MRGKTGLIEDRDRRTAWSSSRRCEAAFEALVASARCREIVMSYNAEGIIPNDHRAGPENVRTAGHLPPLHAELPALQFPL
jgi:adenine-specific DNA methylase